MKRRKKFLLVAGVVLLLIAVSAWYIYGEYNRIHKDTAELKADYVLNATSFITEFETSEKVSNEKYWDKVIEVRGVVKDISCNDAGACTVMLGDTASMSSVRCSMDSLHNSEASLLKKEKIATLKGICTGFNADELLGSDVILVRCVVSKNNNQ